MITNTLFSRVSFALNIPGKSLGSKVMHSFLTIYMYQGILEYSLRYLLENPLFMRACCFL